MAVYSVSSVTTTLVDITVTRSKFNSLSSTNSEYRRAGEQWPDAHWLSLLHTFCSCLHRFGRDEHHSDFDDNELLNFDLGIIFLTIVVLIYIVQETTYFVEAHLIHKKKEIISKSDLSHNRYIWSRSIKLNFLLFNFFLTSFL